ncbi:hypothetical protein N0V93_000559 [Gnomoniopsis smithogilvyi]|uniref:Fe2OG dioxygenase domain-containing protein n=1 Tax=Gnomoniopsis smithogilvyi TaxID=1191159 RepID=A0A9W8Z2F9_9PEZI|nr:hypothetical protein N0V93_000559 [Gnomoniopsis smithogilvyi]
MLAPRSGEVEDYGAIWFDGGEGPVTARLVIDNEGSKPLSTHSGESKQGNVSRSSLETTQPMSYEPTTKICNQSPPVTSAKDAKAVGAYAQDEQSTAEASENAYPKVSAGPEPLTEEFHAASEIENAKTSPSGGDLPSQSGRAAEEMEPPPQSAQMSCNTRTNPPEANNLAVSQKFLMAPVSGLNLKKGIRDGGAEKNEPESGLSSSVNTKSEEQHFKSSSQQQTLDAVTTDPIPEVMAGRCAPKSSVRAPLCEGDTTLVQNFLPSGVIDGVFEQLCEEVHFKTMRHQGSEVPRFVAVQGAIDPDGTQPVYRHPSDESPPLEAFTPTVQLIRAHVEKQLGHPVNHVLIQCYRNSNDYISEHSDKTLDIFRWSYIANVSIGAMRTMVFRTKRGDKSTGLVHAGHSSGSSTSLEAIDRAATKPVDILKDLQPVKRRTTRCPMPHNSLLKMGLVTNEKWLHGIKPDKRPQSEKTAEELAWNSTRISLTFRYIATFLSPSLNPLSASSSEPLIWGQGAVSKTREHAHPVVNGQTPEAVAMLRAFGRENNSPDFDWEANYGCGFDVLHMKAAPRYFGCGDVVIDGRVRIMLAECGVKYARGDIGVDTRQQSLDRGVRGAAVGEVLPVRFVVDDADRTTVVGDIAILLFLDAKHPRKKGSDMEVAAAYSRFYAALGLEQRWKSLWASAANSRRVFARLKPHLMELEKWAAEVARCSGLEPTIADYALWPVLHDIALAWKSLARGRGVGHTGFTYLGLPALNNYYREFGGKE